MCAPWEIRTWRRSSERKRRTALRILAVADEVDEGLYGERLPELRPDLVMSCGDLPFDYLEYLVSRLDVPLLYVPGNHDPSLKPPDTTWMPLRAEVPILGPAGCENIDGRVVQVLGLRVAGLGGSVRYKRGPNQYTQAQMSGRALKLAVSLGFRRVRGGRKLDVLLTHAAPSAAAPATDAAHGGFPAFDRLIKTFRPRLCVHGHVHLYGRQAVDRHVGATRVVNAIPWRMIEL